MSALEEDLEIARKNFRNRGLPLKDRETWASIMEKLFTMVLHERIEDRQKRTHAT